MGLIKEILDGLKGNPELLVLLAVIYLMFRIIIAISKGKDAIIKDLLTMSNGDVERFTRLTTLLEILVSGKGESGK